MFAAFTKKNIFFLNFGVDLFILLNKNKDKNKGFYKKVTLNIFLNEHPNKGVANCGDGVNGQCIPNVIIVYFCNELVANVTSHLSKRFILKNNFCLVKAYNPM